MCGRYSSSAPASLLMEHYAVAEVRTAPLPANHNVAPTEPVHAVLERGGVRELHSLRWGLVPSWAADLRVGGRLINARAESVTGKPAFRRAFERRRCLLPADGWYEWMALPGRRKQPFFLRRRDGEPLAFAGLWEQWWDPAAPDGEPVRSCTIVTTVASEAVRAIHDRMPLVLAPTDWDRWLDERAGGADVAGLLVPPLAGFEAFPVGRGVNDVRNKGAELLLPVPPEPVLF